MTDSDAVREWWKDCVFYQIYPRSFQDSNGDGFGDLSGIISRLDALAALGIGAIWLSPVYPSPDADNGYDIADYCDIDPRYGTLDDFDHLVAEASQRGIKIIMDLVINHTSSAHPWFQASRRRDDTYSDYYIWRPSAPDGGPPNNWTSFFMGPAWEWDEVRGEWYLHLFDPKQPDLNYDNRAVIDQIKTILRFWLDRGVAGFRCDVITLLYKQSFADGKPMSLIRGLEHYKTTKGTHDILAELNRDVLTPYHAFTIGETVMVNVDEAHDLTDPSRHELDEIFTFDHLEVDRVLAKYVPKPFSAKKLMERLGFWQRELSWNAICFENHDQPRIVSHYGDDGQYWARSAMLLATLLLTLKGTPFIYQGQEIGMTNFDFTSLDQLNDVESIRMDAMLRDWHLPQKVRWSLLSQASRDNARTPMQWDSSQGAGFTTGTPWLGINANKDHINYAEEVDDPRSVLTFYRKLIELRKAKAILREGDFEPVYATKSVMVYRRVPTNGLTDLPVTILLNFSGHTQGLSGRWDGKILASNIGRRNLDGILKPWEAAIVEDPAPHV